MAIKIYAATPEIKESASLVFMLIAHQAESIDDFFNDWAISKNQKRARQVANWFDQYEEELFCELDIAISELETALKKLAFRSSEWRYE